MIYISNTIRATLELMEAPKEKITIRTSYNISGTSFNPSQLATSIKNSYSNFKINYKPYFRQEIENSWGMNIGDAEAKKGWNWKPMFEIKITSETMLKN